MSQSDESASDDAMGTEVADWFAKSTLRIALTVIGLVIILFALGQAVGFDLLGVVVDFLGSTTGRWLVVAFFGLLLIVAALRGFDSGTNDE